MRLIFLPPKKWPEITDVQINSSKNDQVTIFHFLKEMKIDFEIINPSKFPFNPLSNKNPFLCGLDLFRALKILIFYRNVDVIISVFESGGFFVLLLRKLFAFKPKVIVWDASVGNKWKVVKAIQSIVFPRYDSYLMLITKQKEYLKNQANVKKQIHLVYYNVDESFFHPVHNQADEYLLAVGDDISRDYETLYLATKDINFPLLLKTKWKYNGSFERIVPIKYISDRLSDTDFRDLYSKAIMVILPLFNVPSAGGITALFEAMAMGKPVVITDSSTASDFAINGLNSIVVKSGDVSEMAKAIKNLLDDSKLREKLGLTARITIESKFSSKLFAKRMIDSVSKIVESV